MQIFTDGACRPNPGPGGWAAYIPELDKMVSGEVRWTTNNEMEMMAVLYGLAEVPDNSDVSLTTDSKMVQGWLGKGWKCEANPKIAALRESIQCLIAAKQLHVGIRLVKGHSGNAYNEKVDREAHRRAGLAKDLVIPEDDDAKSLRLILQVDNLCMENLNMVIKAIEKLGGLVSGAAEEYSAALEMTKTADIQNGVIEMKPG